MTRNRDVYKEERIVPVRFERSTDAAPDATWQRPDLDDRGFTVQHGPIVGVCRSDKVQISVRRDLLDDKAQLFATSEDKAKVDVHPSTVEILAGEKAPLRLLVGTTDGDVSVYVRSGALNGPIIAELVVHVSEVIDVLCAVHRTAIYNLPGARAAANTTARSFANITSLIDEVNRQWRPCGIHFKVDTQKDDTNLDNQVSRNAIVPSDGVLLCPVFGSGVSNDNFGLLMNTNKVADRLNLYFVRSIGTASATGEPFYIGFGSAAHRGCVVSDSAEDLETQAHTLAHELGHILNIAGRGGAGRKAECSHSDDDPDWDADVPKRRHDQFSRRRLMYYMVGLQASDRHPAPGRYTFELQDTGYGPGRSGHMITIKDLANDATDNEYNDARTAAQAL